MKIHILILSLSWIYSASHAQLITIYDNDGYTNVRKTASLKSTVIGIVKEGQVFSVSPFDDENGNQEWSNVWFQKKTIDKNLHYLKSESVTSSGYVHKSRIAYLRELPEVKPVQVSPNKLVFKNNLSEITFDVKPFQQSKDGNMEVNNIIIKSSSGIYTIPKGALAGLRDIHIEQVKLFQGKKREIYITATGADGSDTYQVAWCIKNNKLYAMTVMQTIP